LTFKRTGFCEVGIIILIINALDLEKSTYFYTESFEWPFFRVSALGTALSLLGFAVNLAVEREKTTVAGRRPFLAKKIENGRKCQKSLMKATIFGQKDRKSQ
jgi:hypothetical protein